MRPDFRAHFVQAKLSNSIYNERSISTFPDSFSLTLKLKAWARSASLGKRAAGVRIGKQESLKKKLSEKLRS